MLWFQHLVVMKDLCWSGIQKLISSCGKDAVFPLCFQPAERTQEQNHPALDKSLLCFGSHRAVILNFPLITRLSRDIECTSCGRTASEHCWHVIWGKEAKVENWLEQNTLILLSDRHVLNPTTPDKNESNSRASDLLSFWYKLVNLTVI